MIKVGVFQPILHFDMIALCDALSLGGVGCDLTRNASVVCVEQSETSRTDSEVRTLSLSSTYRCS